MLNENRSQGGPGGTGDQPKPSRVLSARIGDDLFERLRDLADEHRLSLKEVIEAAIENYISLQENVSRTHYEGNGNVTLRRGRPRDSASGKTLTRKTFQLSATDNSLEATVEFYLDDKIVAEIAAIVPGNSLPTGLTRRDGTVAEAR